MDASLKYPVGIQTFPEIIEEGYVYADKTGYVRRLVKSGKYYFLSRPRRFGKSMFLTTLEAYFEGRRDLFKGLALDSYDDVDWTPRPVIKMAFNALDPKTPEDLVRMVSNRLSFYEKRYGVEDVAYNLADRFINLIMRANEKTGRKVAVLIDEYDAPLLATLLKPELNEKYRDTIKSLLTVLKTADEYIGFAFVTGVSRFSHTSLFSGANNLNDISMANDYAAICGITEEELTEVFLPGIRKFAKELEITEEDALRLLKENYDGYHFSYRCPDIYNPYSLLKALDLNEIGDYWFQSGTPTYLLDVLKRDGFYLPDLDCIESMVSGLSAKESYLNNPVALLFETGYVTIKSYDRELEAYTLGLPNREVATSFSKALVPIYSGFSQSESENLVLKMKSALLKGNPELFLDVMSTFMEGNPYSNTELRKRETYFKNNIYILLRAIGFEPEAERETCRGRIDLLLKTRRFIYVFELKVDKSTGTAMRQIEERGYTLPFRHSDRPVISIAATYDPATNSIDSICRRAE